MIDVSVFNLKFLSSFIVGSLVNMEKYIRSFNKILMQMEVLIASFI